jgi:hypothetical protein
MGATLDDVVASARAAGLTCTRAVDATEATKPSYDDHGDGADRPGSAAFSAHPAVALFVDLHRRDLLTVAYLAFEHSPEHG